MHRFEELLQERRRRCRRVNLHDGYVAIECVEPYRDPSTAGLSFISRVAIAGPQYFSAMVLDGALAELVDVATKYLELDPPAQRLEFVMAAPPAPKKKRPKRGNLFPLDAAAAAVGHLAPDELAIHRRMLEGK